MGYEASDSSGKLWVLGVRKMVSKSAVDTFSVFKEILSDIDLICQQSEHAPSKLILQHTVATMSDRAATKVKFNTLLKYYRETIMPTVIDNYDQMPESERTAIGYLANFFLWSSCSHPHR